MVSSALKVRTFGEKLVFFCCFGLEWGNIVVDVVVLDKHGDDESIFVPIAFIIFIFDLYILLINYPMNSEIPLLSY